MLEPENPTLDEKHARDWNVVQSVMDLQNVVDGVYPYFHLSGVFNRLRTRPKELLRICEADRDRLLRGLVMVRASVPYLFAEPRDLALAVRGMDALAVTIMDWAEAEDRRRLRPKHVIYECRLAARVMQNLCHNASIEQELEERALRYRVKPDARTKSMRFG